MKKIQRSILLLLVSVLAVCLCGCGVSHGSPEGVVKSLIEAFGKSSMKDAKDCYGLGKKDSDMNLENEIDSKIRYIEAHNTKKVQIVDCGTLFNNDYYSYVYVTYNLVLEDTQEYPCVDTYMVSQLDRKYYVVKTADITSEMSNTAVSCYKEFMNSDAYKEYRRAYDTFIKKNPGYEDKIAGKVN